ncbi:MAG: NAD(P)-binding domain-containing protein, partial [Stenotrophomonas sp.]
MHLFSPAGWSSIPGWPMPASQGPYPARAEVLAYLAQYEQKYALPIIRPIGVQRITRVGERLRVEASDGRQWLARAVISATGTWGEPYTPEYEGLDSF